MNQKRTKRRFIVKQFEKHRSIFRDWHEDTDDTIKACFNLEISRTRVRKYINNDKVYKEVCQILLANFRKIKEIFTHCIGISSYPYMSWLEFTRICTYWKLPGIFKPYP